MSLTSFQNARGIAECLDDKAAEMAIGKAIDDVKNRIETGIVIHYYIGGFSGNRGG